MVIIYLFTVLDSINVEEIMLKFLKFSWTDYDLAHSAISHAIKHGGILFILSQLFPVFKLARRQNLYGVKVSKLSPWHIFFKNSRQQHCKSCLSNMLICILSKTAVL